MSQEVPRTALPGPGFKSILDAQATAQLHHLLGARAVPIVDVFLKDLPMHLEKLRAAIERGVMPVVRNEAHTMKGSSSNLGASGFACLCTQVSDICKSGELHRLRAAYAALEQEFHLRVAPALEQFKQVLLQEGNPEWKTSP